MDSKDAFDRCSPEQQQTVKIIVSEFHFRDGVIHPDGSMGVVRLTPKQLRDAIGFALMKGDTT